MKRTIFVLAMSLFLPATINAADIDGNYAIVSVEGVIESCGLYVAARDEGRRGGNVKERYHISWIAGYLTAYNLKTPDTYDIGGQTILLWLENYCKRNPLAGLAKAVELLTVELHPKRIRTKPK